MANIEKISIALPSEMVEDIRHAVQSGDYATTSEVIRDALRDWRCRRISVDPSDAKTLRKLVAEGMASGPSIDAELVFEELRKRYASSGPRGRKREAAGAVAKRKKRS